MHTKMLCFSIESAFFSVVLTRLCNSYTKMVNRQTLSNTNPHLLSQQSIYQRGTQATGASFSLKCDVVQRCHRSPPLTSGRLCHFGRMQRNECVSAVWHWLLLLGCVAAGEKGAAGCFGCKENFHLGGYKVSWCNFV